MFLLQIVVLTTVPGHLDQFVKMHLECFPVGYLEKMIEISLIVYGVDEGSPYCKTHAVVCILDKWFCVLPTP